MPYCTTGVSSTFSPDIDKVREAMKRDDVTGDKGDMTIITVQH